MGLYLEPRSELTLVIDTDQYSGNFERQMFAFIFGEPDTPDGGTRDLSYYTHAAKAAGVSDAFFDRCRTAEEPAYPILIAERINDPGDDGVHVSYVTICPTPGWFLVDGGEHYEDTEANRARFPLNVRHPAFQSVAVFLEREPTADELKLIKERAHLFTTFPRKNAWDARPKILGFRLVTQHTTFSSKDL